ncbi:uncharacterized protein LOC107370440 [Tetranychus urticae]|uniref:Uncharacterized protein n=1 Tax=Tetranychus urticae TaxID=32264 RepID=T1L5J7_TETUR|nr:uncharacterized protein LOC107370440 [Tetranychus urticae]
MADQVNSYKTTFKVKFLGDYHDIDIDWSDKYGWHQQKQQLLGQLQSITGVPCKYVYELLLPILREPLQHVQPRDDPYHYAIRNQINYWSAATHKEEFFSAIRYAENSFHLAYDVHFDSVISRRFINIRLRYRLVPERMVPEGVCRHGFCQHRNTKSIFNRIKDIINNDEFNETIWSQVYPIRGLRTRRGVYRQFNVLQYSFLICDDVYSRFPSDAYRLINSEPKVYLRARG